MTSLLLARAEQPSDPASGMLPVIDTEVTPDNLELGLQRLESRQVFGIPKVCCEDS